MGAIAHSEKLGKGVPRGEPRRPGCRAACSSRDRQCASSLCGPRMCAEHLWRAAVSRVAAWTLARAARPPPPALCLWPRWQRAGLGPEAAACQPRTQQQGHTRMTVAPHSLRTPVREPESNTASQGINISYPAVRSGTQPVQAETEQTKLTFIFPSLPWKQ